MKTNPVCETLITPESLEGSGWKKKVITERGEYVLNFHTWTRWVSANGKNRRIMQRISFIYGKEGDQPMVDVILKEKVGSTCSWVYKADEFCEANLEYCQKLVVEKYNIKFR